MLCCWLIAVRKKILIFSYQSTTVENNNNTPKLNIFVPRENQEARANTSIDFLYMEENWNSGRKELL
jgi:hypothetical protein